MAAKTSEREVDGIRQLPPSVVHRIAAGEVIQRPVNALKELLDNSVDAGARSVRVVVKGGGLQLLQVSDDGCGVRERDLELLCVRHATSKMRCEEDLKDMATLGFRGEALASMSYVAHVSCVTKPRASRTPQPQSSTPEEPEEHALRATYRDGTLVDKSVCAGTCGTTIIVEDLFFATPMRKKGLRSASDEYRRIVDVVSRYAVHHRGIAFSCRRQEDGMKPPDVQVSNVDSPKARIDLVYGRAVANELLEISIPNSRGNGDGTNNDNNETAAFDASPHHQGEEGDADCDFQLHGFVTSANYHASRTTMILFINDRLVEMTPLRRAVESVYASILPKASKPFLYFSIQTARRNVDVNLHPTKHEVGLLNADKIVQEVQAQVEKVLLASNDGRVYVFSQSQRLAAGRGGRTAGAAGGGGGGGGTQSKLDQSMRIISNVDGAPLRNTEKADGAQGSRPPVYAPNRLVRTDATAVPLEAFALGSQLQTRNLNFVSLTQATRKTQCTVGPPENAETNSEHTHGTTVVLALIDEFEKDVSADLQTFFRSHVYVGMLTPEKAIVQFRTGLYAINASTLSQELCYQLLLHNAIVRDSNCRGHRDGRNGGESHHAPPAAMADVDDDGGNSNEPMIRFAGKGIPVGETVQRALRAMEEDGDWDAEDGSGDCVARLVVDIVSKYQGWMHHTFNVLFVGARSVSDVRDSCDVTRGDDEVYLKGLPACFGKQYVPDLGRLPDFLLAMGRDVVWGDNLNDEADESERTRTFCRALAELYTFVMDDVECTAEDAACKENQYRNIDNGEWKMQHLLCPLLKSSFCPPKEISTDGTVVMITKLETLYRVFERC